ncbi:MAG: LysM peptidoglycan-binding domain-containing protein [Actinomycetes bacterium]
MANSPASPAALTLTNRGRTVIMVSALIVATSTFAATFSAFNGAAASTTSTTTASTSVSAEEIIVQPGESYWSIAREIAPGVSTQDVIDQIHQLNPFEGSTLQAGTKILVPLLK